MDKDETTNSNKNGSEQLVDFVADTKDEEKPDEQEESGRNPDGTYKKGFSGNLKGGPKKPTIWDYLNKDEDKAKIREFINDPKFLDKVAEYILGKPKLPLVGGDEDEPIRITGINFIYPNGYKSTPNDKTDPSL